MQRDDSLLLDMLQAARQIREYTSGLQETDFLNSRRDQDAVLLQCTVLGEMAKRVSLEFRNAHSEIPWRKIMGFRTLWFMTIFRSMFTGSGRLRAVISPS